MPKHEIYTPSMDEPLVESKESRSEKIVTVVATILAVLIVSLIAVLMGMA